MFTVPIGILLLFIGLKKIFDEIHDYKTRMTHVLNACRYLKDVFIISTVSKVIYHNIFFDIFIYDLKPYLLIHPQRIIILLNSKGRLAIPFTF